MSRYILKFSDALAVLQAPSEYQIAGEFGKGVHKELVALYTLDAGTYKFEVRSHRSTTFATTNLASAVAAYNELE